MAASKRAKAPDTEIRLELYRQMQEKGQQRNLALREKYSDKQSLSLMDQQHRHQDYLRYQQRLQEQRTLKASYDQQVQLKHSSVVACGYPKYDQSAYMTRTLRRYSPLTAAGTNIFHRFS